MDESPEDASATKRLDAEQPRRLRECKGKSRHLVKFGPNACTQITLLTMCTCVRGVVLLRPCSHHWLLLNESSNDRIRRTGNEQSAYLDELASPR